MMLNNPLDTLCAQLDIKIIGPRQIPKKARQTRARQSLDALLQTFGEGQLVLTLKCITDTGNEANAACLSADVIMAVSDVLQANPHYDQYGTALLDAFACIDLTAMRQDISNRFNTHMRLRLETLIALELNRQLSLLESTQTHRMIRR